ncbi:hypothetical protein KVR01_000931 [Diaporthe batatas]|uniref:uncharacterized protein n=1 Tax=Diaporthe batatas TaxID=748121 RepID=UPI001D055196|nr:uncharacterized protein KVR01_000931 [Diaporthe batatas]KAG8170186.1 hypothetical protein KVR01_000931 [Diaporthe batatas]
MNAPNSEILEKQARDWRDTLRSGLYLLISKIHGHPDPLKEPQTARTTTKSSDDAPKLWTKAENCQVERRTLYVSNPNEWTALVLVETASPTQAPVLLDFIDRYLKFETSISVNVNRSYTDSRQNHQRVPLRQSFELPYMHLLGTLEDLPKPGRWICESQVSLLVSIVDLNGWTAYVFEDTYYKEHQLPQYWDDFCSQPGYYYPDALTSGKLDSTRFLEPRMYFLRVFETRIEQVYREWRVAVDTLAEIVKRHRPERILTALGRSGNQRKGKREKQILLQQRYSEWITNMTSVVSDQSEQISTTLTAWDEFEKRCTKYFPEDVNSPLETKIGHTFSMIKLLKVRLDGLSQEIARDQSALSAQLAVENTGTAKLVKALTVISIQPLVQ